MHKLISSVTSKLQAFDLLYSASHGNHYDLRRITDIIAESESIKQQKITAQKELARARPAKLVSKKQQKKEETEHFQKLTARRHPDALPILSRPRPVVSGKRRIPVLVNARGVPFLRIKKPQPKNLSGVLRTKLEKRWNLVERRERLQMDQPFTKDEDDWDSLTGHEEKTKWRTAVQTAIKDANQKIHHTDMKNKKHAEALWEVVLAERTLAEKEQKQNSIKPDVLV
ncbi:hypothetical protein EYZ11_001586 [Aspergillus tanneri]|uniref:Uncharacterized protein n=1 Tax=Aspergillus tanneri TaxID=1220188 RepID=A0A4S3JSW8_9EURO|nr:hypothetical protein EYZ11_001586 [Aspergillus tanneri]